MLNSCFNKHGILSYKALSGVFGLPGGILAMVKQIIIIILLFLQLTLLLRVGFVCLLLCCIVFHLYFMLSLLLLARMEALSGFLVMCFVARPIKTFEKQKLN